MKPRLAHLDGLRALAALFVVVNHAQDTVYHTTHATGLARVLTGWMEYGHLAVVAFIVLSGYSLTLGVVRNGGWFSRGAAGFLKGRFRRIVPPYWASVTVSLLLALFVINERTGTKWDDSTAVHPLGVAAHYFLLQDLVSDRAPNYPLWTISVEWQIYFLFPLLLLLFMRVNLYAATAVGVLVTLAATKLITLDIILFNSLYLVGAFMIGVCACYIVDQTGQLRVAGRSFRVPAASIFVLCLVATIGLALMGAETNVLNAPTEVGVGALLVALGTDRLGALRAVLTWRPLVYVGLFSYSIYLMHAPLLQLVWQFGLRPLDLDQGAQMALLLVPGSLLIVAACWVFFRFAERPFLTPSMKAAESREMATI